MAKPVEEAAPIAPVSGAAPEPTVAITRFQAQRSFGLFAKWDYTMLILIGLVWVNIGYYWMLRPAPSFNVIFFGLLLTILLSIAWLIVLVYRVLVFLLDMHADVALLPEAASRIVLGYYEGRKK
jgi:hypothetical protein